MGWLDGRMVRVISCLNGCGISEGAGAVGCCSLYVFYEMMVIEWMSVSKPCFLCDGLLEAKLYMISGYVQSKYEIRHCNETV